MSRGKYRTPSHVLTLPSACLLFLFPSIFFFFCSNLSLGSAVNRAISQRPMPTHDCDRNPVQVIYPRFFLLTLHCCPFLLVYFERLGEMRFRRVGMRASWHQSALLRYDICFFLFLACFFFLSFLSLSRFRSHKRKFDSSRKEKGMEAERMSRGMATVKFLFGVWRFYT